MRGMWWLWIFPIIGIGLLIGAGYALHKAQQFKASALKGVGRVIDYKEYDSTDSDGHTTRMYEPLIRFELDGRTHERYSGVGSSHRPYKLGQQLKLLYPPHAPDKFQIDSPGHIYLVPGILGFIGFIFCLVGFIVVGVFNGPQTELVDTPAHELRDYGARD